MGQERLRPAIEGRAAPSQLGCQPLPLQLLLLRLEGLLLLLLLLLLLTSHLLKTEMMPGGVHKVPERLERHCARHALETRRPCLGEGIREVCGGTQLLLQLHSSTSSSAPVPWISTASKMSCGIRYDSDNVFQQPEKPVRSACPTRWPCSRECICARAMKPEAAAWGFKGCCICTPRFAQQCGGLHVRQVRLQEQQA